MKLIGRKRTVVAVVIAVLMIAGATLAALFVSVPNSGIILKGDLAVFTDLQCTQPLVSLDWGSFVAPGDSAVKTVYIKNKGNVSQNYVITLSAGAPAWASISSTYIDGSKLPNQVAVYSIKLSVTAEAVAGSFSGWNTEFAASVAP